MRKYNISVIFTDRFPFGAESERAFLLPEIKAASELFDRVIVVPTSAGGNYDKGGLPENVEVDCFWVDSFAGRNRLVRAVACMMPGVMMRSRGDMSRSGFTFGASAWLASRKIDRWIKKRGFDCETVLFHTFWFDIMAGAMALLSEKRKLHWVSSAHGFDIYTRRGGRLREMMVERVERVFCASESGAEFMRARFREYSGKIAARTLGSPEGFLSSFHGSEERELTVLSVSYIIERKRVELNADLLMALAKGRTGTHVHWIHVGDGPMMNSIRKKLEAAKLPENFTFEFRGKLKNEEVHRIYAEEKVDWFMLLSRYEGGNPIAVCEALSHGVPVIATDTTGLAEAVDDECAVLLALNPQPEEFVRGMLPYLDSRLRYEAMRSAARKRWEEKFDARKLRTEFYEMLQGNK